MSSEICQGVIMVAQQTGRADGEKTLRALVGPLPTVERGPEKGFEGF